MNETIGTLDYVTKRAVSLPNELQIDYDQIDAHGSDVVALQC
jgi:hypothetical protein